MRGALQALQNAILLWITGPRLNFLGSLGEASMEARVLELIGSLRLSPGRLASLGGNVGVIWREVLGEA